MQLFVRKNLSFISCYKKGNTSSKYIKNHLTIYNTDQLLSFKKFVCLFGSSIMSIVGPFLGLAILVLSIFLFFELYPNDQACLAIAKSISKDCSAMAGYSRMECVEIAMSYYRSMFYCRPLYLSYIRAGLGNAIEENMKSPTRLQCIFMFLRHGQWCN